MYIRPSFLPSVGLCTFMPSQGLALCFWAFWCAVWYLWNCKAAMPDAGKVARKLLFCTLISDAKSQSRWLFGLFCSLEETLLCSVAISWVTLALHYLNKKSVMFFLFGFFFFSTSFLTCFELILPSLKRTSSFAEYGENTPNRKPYWSNTPAAVSS